MRFIERSSWTHNPLVPAGNAEFFTPEQLKNRTIESLKDYLRRRIGGYAVAIKDMPTINPIYRGRICNERPQMIEEISYPKPDLVTKFGRVNRIGNSMFYGCVGSFPVFFEIHARVGDHVALSEWGLTESLWMHNLGYHPDALGKLSVPFVAERLPLMNPIPNETKRNSRLRSRMSKAFTKQVPEGNEYLYKETIAINELLFDRASPIHTTAPGAPKMQRVAGTVFPSIQMRGLADNVAIWPQFVDAYLQVKSVRFIRIEKADEANLIYTFLTVASSRTFSNNNIVWDEQLAPEQDRRAHVAFANGRWVFRDGRGNIYDVH